MIRKLYLHQDPQRGFILALLLMNILTWRQSFLCEPEELTVACDPGTNRAGCNGSRTDADKWACSCSLPFYFRRRYTTKAEEKRSELNTPSCLYLLSLLQPLKTCFIGVISFHLCTSNVKQAVDGWQIVEPYSKVVDQVCQSGLARQPDNCQWCRGPEIERRMSSIQAK